VTAPATGRISTRDGLTSNIAGFVSVDDDATLEFVLVFVRG